MMTDDQAIERATAWLVEFLPGGDSYERGVRVGPAYPTKYYTGLRADAHHIHTRTTDPNEAMRFSRKQDAEAMIIILNDNDFGPVNAITTEHLWMSKPSRSDECEGTAAKLARAERIDAALARAPEPSARGALVELEARSTLLLAAIDKHNEKTGDDLAGGVLFRFAAAVGEARKALNDATPPPAAVLAEREQKLVEARTEQEWRQWYDAKVQTARGRSATEDTVINAFRMLGLIRARSISEEG